MFCRTLLVGFVACVLTVQLLSALLLLSSDPVIMKSISSVSEVIDKVETRWPWYFGGDNEKEKLVDMDLNPVLLVPGSLGSILHAVNQNTGSKERVWMRLFNADHEFRSKLYSLYNPETGAEFYAIPFEFCSCLSNLLLDKFSSP